jgi:exoribonuclease II
VPTGKNSRGRGAVTSLPIVVIERRGLIVLAGLQSEGQKKVRVLIPPQHSQKIQRHRLFYKFDHSIAGDSTFSEALERWRALCLKDAQSWLVDQEVLWQSLKDDVSYGLEELCQLYFGTITNEGILSLIQIFSQRQSDFQVADGGLKRVDDETRVKIRERLAAEAQLNEQNDAFLSWLEGGLQGQPEGLEDVLEGLKIYALGGADNVSKRFRHLAAQMDLRNADDLLLWLCDRDLLPRDVNELPHRLGFQQRHSPSIMDAARSCQTELGTALKSADALGSSAWGQHEDLTEHWTLTIDQPATRDVDDALSVWKDGADLYVAIHIADVASFVPRGSGLDEEARKRGSTVYLRDLTIPMFPNLLVEDVISLNAGVVRPAISLILKYEAGQDLATETRFARTLIRVDERLSYIQTTQPVWREHPLLNELLRVARGHKEKRVAAGAVLSLQFELRVHFEYDEPVLSHIRHDTPGHTIVSELMVVYNVHAAQRLKEGQAAALFKVQRVPIREADRLTLEQLKNPLGPIQMRFPPARIAVCPGSHKTLGVPCYVQMTAPIRRFTDLLAQRQLCSLMAGDAPVYTALEMTDSLKEQEKKLSRVRRAEDSRLRYWKHRFLEVDPGPHTAYISRIDPRGFARIYLPKLHMEQGLANLNIDEDNADLFPVGHEVQVLATKFEPRQRRTRLELFEEFDEDYI